MASTWSISKPKGAQSMELTLNLSDKSRQRGVSAFGVECLACAELEKPPAEKGSGQCRACAGSGEKSRYDPIKGRSESISCANCDGSGVCLACGGAGYLPYPTGR